MKLFLWWKEKEMPLHRTRICFEGPKKWDRCNTTDVLGRCHHREGTRDTIYII